MPYKDPEARRRYVREWERKKMQDPKYREAHNLRKKEEQKRFRRKHPEVKRHRDRRDHYAKKFGVTIEWYESKLAAQGSACEVCKGIHQHLHWRTGKRERLHIDHNHFNGRVRGILCSHCNRRIGHVELILAMAQTVTPLSDTWLEKALAYLKRYSNPSEGI